MWSGERDRLPRQTPIACAPGAYSAAAAQGLASQAAATQGLASQPAAAASSALAAQPAAAQGAAAQPAAAQPSAAASAAGAQLAALHTPEQAPVASDRPPMTASMLVSLVFFIVIPFSCASHSAPRSSTPRSARHLRQIRPLPRRMSAGESIGGAASPCDDALSLHLAAASFARIALTVTACARPDKIFL